MVVFYSKNIYFYQTNDSVYSFDPAAGYEKIELKNIDFKTLPQGHPKEFKALTLDEESEAFLAIRGRVNSLMSPYPLFKD